MSVFWFIALVCAGGTALFFLTYLFLVKKYYWGPTGKPPPRKKK